MDGHPEPEPEPEPGLFELRRDGFTSSERSSSSLVPCEPKSGSGSGAGEDSRCVAGKTGDDFAPGQAVKLTMAVGDAPPGSTVKIVWYGPRETKIGEDNKPVVAGQKYLPFNKATKGWAKGDYRAEVWIGDEKVNTQQFQIVDAPKAGK